ncbi:hypothetical protein C8Q78DRAFT_1015119 [Trametes maxima]|nr:hypothetical protein C8Q78DRAFT_1015119 [Trametes maxima]
MVIDGTTYFSVLLAVNIIELCFIREINLLESSSNWLSAVTAIMTARFILDLHEADDRLCGVDSGTPEWADEYWTARRPDIRSFDRPSSNLKSTRVAETSGIYGIVIAEHDEHDYSDDSEQGPGGGSEWERGR